MTMTRTLIAAAALALAGSASAMTGLTDTIEQIDRVTRSTPSVFFGLDGDVLTIGGNLDSRLQELTLVRQLQSVDGVDRVISHVNTF